MKNLVLLILGFLLGALAMYFYCQKDKDSLEGMNPLVPRGIINPDQIKTLTQAYNSRYDSINATVFKDVKGGDNRSSWYSLEDVRNYLTIAEQQAKDLKYNMDGVRLYLGAQPMVGDTPGYTTLLFVPTGTPMGSEGNLLNFTLQGGGGRDIPGGPGLDMGNGGDPPSSNYPQ
ncbi:hypothetical protein [Psychroserpens sp. Hel_I_66]|uniref:hypothetical protein n=1 Tax=Psychroserpens sp. Hel_I_66 TaxID=1250004 RepID=UPI000648834E|nr:hypothetical protein [Psychroserpens sp. Hel_I_66]